MPRITSKLQITIPKRLAEQVGLGPGDEVQAHFPNEHCPVEHLGDAAAFYAAFVAELNGMA